MAEASKVPINESVGAALRFVRANVRFILLASLIGALAGTALSALSFAVPQLSLVALIGSGVVQALVYAAFTGAALYGAEPARARFVSDGLRVWAAMAVIAFFFFIVFVVISIPVLIISAAGPMAPYVGDLQAAGEDQAAVLAVMMRFMEENAGTLLLVTLFYGAVWLLLTSRLFVAAPATIEARRVLAFDTWKLTKGAMWRICAARLMLLVPAYILVSALSHLAGRAVGIDTMNISAVAQAAAANSPAVLAYNFASSFMMLAAYLSMEAGLSAYLYKGLKPPPS